MNHIVQYFYLDYNNNFYGVNDIKREKRNEIYFRCILTFFQSCIEQFKNDDYKLYFVCNEVDNIEFIKNFRFKEFLIKNNIEIIKRKPKYVELDQIWAGAMLLFDAIEALIEKDIDIKPNDNILFFDNDIIFNSSLKDIKCLNEDFDILVYDISSEYIVNNKWMVNFNNIDSKFLEDSKFKPYGGEFLGIKGRYIKEFVEKFKNIYPIQGLITEEHYISYLITYELFSNNVKNINNNLKRVWTTYRYSNLSKNDYSFNILHLPSEKEYGLYYLSNKIIKCGRYNKNVALKILGIRDKYIHLQVLTIIKKLKKKLAIKIRGEV